MKNYEEMTIKELEKIIEEANKAKVTLDTKKKAEADEKAKKLAEEKDARYAAIEAEYEKITKMISDYFKDYGSFRFKRSYKNDNPLDLFNKLFF